MILALLIALFVWAVLATSTALSLRQIVHFTEATVAKNAERIAELEDRIHARNLAEFRAYRPVAMQAPEPEADGYYRYDDTGMIREWVPAAEEPTE